MSGYAYRADLKLGNRITKSYGKGRVCVECDAKISMYNPNRSCWKHADPKKVTVRANQLA